MMEPHEKEEDVELQTRPIPNIATVKTKPANRFSMI